MSEGSGRRTMFCRLRPRAEYKGDKFWADEAIKTAWDCLRIHWHNKSSPKEIGSIRDRIAELGSPYCLDKTSMQLWLQFLEDQKFVQQEAQRAGVVLKPISDPDAVDAVYGDFRKKRRRD